MLIFKDFKYYFDITVSLAWADIKLRYKRSLIGPFWSTINLTIFISFLSLIFSVILGKNLNEFVPFVALGFLFWNFISGCITESADVMIQHREIINNIKLNYLIHPAIVVYRNLLLLLHNILIFPIIFYFFDIELSLNIFYAIIALVVLVLNVFWISAIVSVVCLRYLDFKQIILNLLNISFYLTPIIWDLDTISNRFNTQLLYLNPFYSFVESIRAPILNSSSIDFSFLIFSSCILFFGLLLLILIKKVDSKISLWT